MMLRFLFMLPIILFVSVSDVESLSRNSDSGSDVTFFELLNSLRRSGPILSVGSLDPLLLGPTVSKKSDKDEEPGYLRIGGENNSDGYLRPTFITKPSIAVTTQGTTSTTVTTLPESSSRTTNSVTPPIASSPLHETESSTGALSIKSVLPSSSSVIQQSRKFLSQILDRKPLSHVSQHGLLNSPDHEAKPTYAVKKRPSHSIHSIFNTHHSKPASSAHKRPVHSYSTHQQHHNKHHQNAPSSYSSQHGASHSKSHRPIPHPTMKVVPYLMLPEKQTLPSLTFSPTFYVQSFSSVDLDDCVPCPCVPC